MVLGQGRAQGRHNISNSGIPQDNQIEISFNKDRISLVPDGFFCLI
ncbi:MAG: hypothetical protein A4E72_01907 [Syntrophus sp. PtaU1.Bin208]|nr:MAG: hypothetical protein A4E72_01907 [Syntrophus sp. PtaU1.Bin208]